MINIHAAQTLSADGYGDLSLRYTAPGTVTDTIPATTYDETADIITSINGVSALTWGLGSDGKVSVSSGGLFTPKYYDSTDQANQGLYNNLWALLGFDTSNQPGGAGILFKADYYPQNTIWLDVINEVSQDGRQSIVQQAVGLQGHIKQVQIANLTTKRLAHLYVDDTQRQATESWYSLAATGSLVTVNNGVTPIGTYYLDESMLGGVSNVLSRDLKRYRYYKMQMRLRAA